MEFSTYELDNPNVKGQIRVLAVPVIIMEIPERLVPEEAKTPGIPTYSIMSQNVIGFVNTGKKGPPSPQVYTPEELKKSKKVDISSYAQDSPFEPWNEFVIEGTPAILIKQRTILAKVELVVDHYNQFGDPILMISPSITNSVSIATTGEAGLT